ncbi:antirestriction protein, partial [bacterium C-53]
KSFRNSAAYVQNWLSVLRNDVKFIVSASSKAEKAVDYILGEA